MDYKFFKFLGKIYIDIGAAKALLNGKSLLAAGILRISGKFKKGDNVLIVDHEENNLARGLSSFPLMKLLRSKVNKVMRFKVF